MSQHSRSVWHDDGVIRSPETKSFILTSEFWVAAGAAAAVFIGAYALDDIADAISVEIRRVDRDRLRREPRNRQGR